MPSTSVRAMIRLLLPPLAFVAASANFAPADAARKCPAATPGPFLFIDGEAIGFRSAITDAGEALRTKDGAVLDSNNIMSIEIRCMNPHDSTFTTDGTGIGAISIWSKSGPAGQLEPTVIAVLRAQQAHRAEHGAFAETTEALELQPIHPGVRVSMNVQSNGWIATATVERYGQQCLVFAGDIDPPNPDVQPETPHCARIVIPASPR